MLYRIDQFSGLNQSTDEHQISGRYAPDARNIDTRDGNLAVCAGYKQLWPAPPCGAVGSLAAFYRRQGGATQPIAVATAPQGIYARVDGGWQQICTLAGSAASSAVNYQIGGEDVLLLADGVRPLLKWPGEGEMQPIAAAPAAFSQLALHYERLWGSGVADQPDAVYWSRAFDPENWAGDAALPDAGGGVVLIPTWNGGRVVAIAALFNDVLVFKDDDLYRIVGTYPGNYEVVRAHGIVGPIAPRTVAGAGSACYFLSRQGLCAFDGLTAAPLPNPRARRFFERVNPSAARLACAAVHRDRLYLAAPVDDATANNAVLELSLSDGGAMERDGISAACLLPLDDALLFAGPDGRVFRYGEGGTLDGAPIQAWWRTPWIDMDNPVRDKRVTALHLFASGTFALTFETDCHLVERTVALGERERPARIRLAGHGPRFRLTIRNVDGSAFRIRGGLAVEMDDEA